MPAEIRISTLLANPSPQEDSAPGYRLLRATLQDGVDVLVWQGEHPQPVSLNIRDDWGRVQFCCALQGHSRFSFGTGQRSAEFVLTAGASCISHTPECRGRSTHTGPIQSVTVAVRPDLLHELAPDIDPTLTRKLHSAHCYVPCRCTGEMRATAQTLSHALQQQALHTSHEAPRPSLWLLGQSLVLASLMIEAHRDAAAPSALPSQADHPKLLRARDLLLTDLTRALTIAELAQETGLSAQKLKRGFRQLFRQSVYGLFQQERMHEARRRLSTAAVPVMTVAADLGYANASHFTAAFQKQFGINPSTLKRRG